MSVDVKTMRLRYAGVCVGCGRSLEAGERAHYLRSLKAVRCLPCGPAATDALAPAPAVDLDKPPGTEGAAAAVDHGGTTDAAALGQGPLPRAGGCNDCGRRLRRGIEAMCSPDGGVVLCLECVALDTVHIIGVAGASARREHEKRRQRHHTRVRTTHPRLGGLILALSEDPAHVRAWQTGAVGEEEFGRKLDTMASERLKVLHSRKRPRSVADIDHLAVTSQGVWVLDAKRYKGKVETRGPGLFSRRPPDLYIGGRNQTKLVDGVKAQVGVVKTVLAAFTEEHGIRPVPVRGALVFINAEFGLWSSPLAIDGVWIGWGKAIRKRLANAAAGPVPVADVAKRLARELKPGECVSS